MNINDLYNSIVDDVIDKVKDAFVEEGMDEQTLKSLKETWLRRIRDSQQPRQPGGALRSQAAHLQQPQQLVVVESTDAASLHKLRQDRLAPATTMPKNITQLDGSSGTSEDDDDLDDDNDDESDGDFQDADLSDADDDKEADTNRDNEDPLNSGDDVSNDDSSEMFETDNVVVCQYDKITRNRNKWKFHLKDGMMTINGRDYVFQKAIGDAEW